MDIHRRPLILASGSAIRAQLLRNAGLPFEALPVAVDEETLRQGLTAEGASPRDIADALAESKAHKAAGKRPDGLVLGCDQVLAFEGAILSKPGSAAEAEAQLTQLSGKSHMLLSAMVLYRDAQPVWRYVAQVRLTMRTLSAPFVTAYVARNWPGLCESVGGYKLEEEGGTLFTDIQGDYFSVLGLPLLPLVSYLTDIGWRDS